MGRRKVEYQFRTRPDSKFLQVAYYDEGGNRRWKTTGETDKYKARLLVDKWKSEGGVQQGIATSHLTVDAVQSQLTFGELTKDFFSMPDSPYLALKRNNNAKVSESSISTDKQWFDNWIVPYFKEVPFSRINAKVIGDFTRHLQTTPSKKTHQPLSSNAVHNVVSSLKKFLRALYRLDRVPNDKSGLVASYSRDDTRGRTLLTTAEVKRLLVSESMYRRFWKLHMREWAMVQMAYLCGMRIGEIQALRYQSISKRSGKDKSIRHFAFISATYFEEGKKIKTGTKTYLNRWVPLRREIMKAIDGVRDHNRPESALPPINSGDYIFKSDLNDRPVYRSTVNGVYKKALKMAGIEKRSSIHMGRHFFESYLKGKVSDDLLDIALGHSQGKVKDAYTNLSEMMETLEPIYVEIGRMLASADDFQVEVFDGQIDDLVFGH